MHSCSNNIEAKNKKAKELMFIMDLPRDRHCSKPFISLCPRYLWRSWRHCQMAHEIKTLSGNNSQMLLACLHSVLS